MTKESFEEAAKIESFTAKGLKLEYIIMGEKIIVRMNKKPTGPTKGLYHEPFPSYLSLRI